MTSFLRFAAIPALLFTVATASGNAPAPLREPEVPPVAPAKAATGISVPVEVSYVKANGNPMAKIVIPLATLNALVETAKANKSLTLPLGVAEPGEPTSGFTHGGTIIAGLAISLAMVSMVYLLRRKPTHKWAVTGTAVVLLGLGVTSYLWADIRVPGRPYNGPARNPELDRPVKPQWAGPMVTIDVVEKGDSIQIIVPPAAAQ